jgi:hypothetical protein
MFLGYKEATSTYLLPTSYETAFTTAWEFTLEDDMLKDILEPYRLKYNKCKCATRTHLLLVTAINILAYITGRPRGIAHFKQNCT